MAGARIQGLAACALLALAACGDKPPPVADAADLVLLNGRVYTVNAGRDWAQAVAIRDGTIRYVGDDDGARELVGPATRVVDLGGRMLLPAFRTVTFTRSPRVWKPRPAT